MAPVMPGRVASTTAIEDLDDFATYVAERRPVLLRAACGITGDRGTAEDLLHSALASVLPRWGRLRDRSAADAYVRRVMVNQYRTWLRQQYRHREHPVAEPPEDSTRAAGPDRGVDPNLRAAVWELVTGLPPRQRATVVLRYYEGLTEPETARALGCGVGTVKSSTSRGLATLRQRAADAGLAPDLLAG